MKVVNKPLRKKDAMQLVTGQPVYMDDVIPEDCLCVKLLRSPARERHRREHQHRGGDEGARHGAHLHLGGRAAGRPRATRRRARPTRRPSPYDRLVIDRHVRFVGDVVAIVAGEDEKCVDKAMRLIKVKYEVLEPVLDFHYSQGQPHPRASRGQLGEPCVRSARTISAICARTTECGSGDIEAVLRTTATS